MSKFSIEKKQHLKKATMLRMAAREIEGECMCVYVCVCVCEREREKEERKEREGGRARERSSQTCFTVEQFSLLVQDLCYYWVLFCCDHCAATPVLLLHYYRDIVYSFEYIV